MKKLQHVQKESTHRVEDGNSLLDGEYPEHSESTNLPTNDPQWLNGISHDLDDPVFLLVIVALQIVCFLDDWHAFGRVEEEAIHNG